MHEQKTRTLADQIQSRCKHFTGIQNNTCKLGVPYSSFAGPIPCTQWPGREIKAVCPLREFPTAEEVAEELKEIDDAISDVRQNLSPCCKAPLEGRSITEGRYAGAGTWYCSKCRKFVMRKCVR